MPRPVSRRAAAKRAKTPAFQFQTRALRGVPQETPAEREEKARLVREFLERKK